MASNAMFNEVKNYDMIKTRKGWERATVKRRTAQKEYVGSLPIAFACTCSQHSCGCKEMVVVKTIPFCRGCGKPLQLPNGTYWKVEHHELCISA